MTWLCRYQTEKVVDTKSRTLWLGFIVAELGVLLLDFLMAKMKKLSQ